MVADDSNLTCVICFWAERYMDELTTAHGSVIAIVKARVSDYYHKSLNANEDSKVFLNPSMAENS